MRIKSFILAVLLSSVVFSQNYDFGEVSVEELSEKFYPTDSSASAAYLYKDRNTSFHYDQSEGFVLVTKIHERIKIYSKEGFDYATTSVPLYKSGSSRESVTGLKGYTYNLANGKVEDFKLKKDGIFKSEISKFFDETKFTLPNIKEGCVVEYKYEIRSPFYTNVDVFEFQHDIPIKKLQAKFSAPEYFVFQASSKGFLNVIPKESRVNDKIIFNNKTRNNGRYTTSTTYSTDELSFYNNISTFDLSDVPALKEEPHVNNIRNYRSAMKYELSYTSFPNSPIKHYATTWGDVVKTIYENPSFGGELDKSGYFESDIDELLSGVSDPMEKAARIYDYVKSNVKWNGYYSKYSNNGLRKAYKEHTGNVADINLMLTAMLRYAGLDANPVLVSTRKNGVPLFPTREGYNYVICGIEVPNDIVLLDATSKYSAPNVLPFRALNWQGRVIRKSGSSALIDLYPKTISKNTTSLFLKLDDTGLVEGQMRAVKTGHKARNYRNKYNSTDEEQFITNLENKFDGMEIEEFKVSNNKNLGKPVMESCKFSIESQADIIEDKIYFSPMFFFKMNENPFKLEKREFPIDFGYPSDDIYRFNITLPEGYTVVSAPKSKKLELPDNLGSFVYQVKVNGSMIQLVIDSKINVPIVSPIYYDALKSYFSGLIEAENEQIVLTKA